ncbi:pentapeptide repeat-containing protein [Roseivivax sp. CAU 1753]
MQDEPIGEGLTKKEALEELHVSPHDASLRMFALWSKRLTAQRIDMERAVQTVGRLNKNLVENKEHEDCVDLSKANLQGFRLNALDFRYGNFEGASMHGVKLCDAKLAHAKFQNAHMTAADLRGAKLQRAEMDATWLQYAKLRGEGLAWSSLLYTEFDFAKIEHIDLKNVSFRTAILRCALFSHCRMNAHSRLSHSHICGAAFRHIDLSMTGISDLELERVFGDATVQLPDEVKWPTHWPKVELGIRFGREWQKWWADPKTYTPPDPD